jgi:hypothetical protein
VSALLISLKAFSCSSPRTMGSCSHTFVVL